MTIICILLLILVCGLCFVLPLTIEIKAEKSYWRKAVMSELKQTNDYDRIVNRFKSIKSIYKHLTDYEIALMAIDIELPDIKFVRFSTLFSVTKKELAQYILNDMNKTK